MRPGRTWRTRLALAALSGILLNAAFPPFDQGWLAFVALVPLCVAVRGASVRAGALVGLVWGIGFFGILLLWISHFGFLAWTLLVLTMSAFVAVFAALAPPAGRLGPVARAVAWPAIWATLELARAIVPYGGFTWGSLGYTQAAGGNTLPVARLGGVYLLSAVVLAVNVLIAEALLTRRRGPALAALGLVVLPGFLPVGLAGARAGTLDVAAVQGNVPPGRFTTLGRAGRVGPEDTVIIDNHVRLTETLRGDPPELIVWPENAFDRDPGLWPSLFGPVAALQREIGAPLIMPAILDAGERFTNSNLLVEDGRIGQRYDKVHLVPFGEYVPIPFARDLVPVLREELPSDGLPGRALVPFDVGGTRIGTLICFESTYASLARDLVGLGSELLVVTTNNASFGTSPAAAEHLAMSRMRAVEHGRAVVHAAISGISAVIGPDGEVLDRLELGTAGVLRAELPLATARTPYARYGAGIEVAMAVIAALLVIAGAARRRA